jgi:ubiquinone/menaquinone biosynthesis C-methylase UbiE
VEGVDASREFVRLAAERNQHPERVAFQMAGLTLPFPNSYFDLVFSLLVLQHIPPREQLMYLTEFARVARPNGLMALQFFGAPIKRTSRIGAALPTRLLVLYRTLRYRSQRMDIYAISPERVIKHLNGLGVSVVDLTATEDRAAAYVSYHLIGQRGCN